MKLVPRMIQRMEILQKSITLLNQCIEQELLDNQFLEKLSENSPAQRETPEFCTELDDDGKCFVKLIDEYIPKLRIRDDDSRLWHSHQSDELNEEVKKKIESATFLIDSIEHRYETLRRVAQAIVDHQSLFFQKGSGQIRPLKMVQIANATDLHVTTISRSVDNKWIETAQGDLPLRCFFVDETRNWP